MVVGGMGFHFCYFSPLTSTMSSLHGLPKRGISGCVLDSPGITTNAGHPGSV